MRGGRVVDQPRTSVNKNNCNVTPHQPSFARKHRVLPLELTKIHVVVYRWDNKRSNQFDIRRHLRCARSSRIGQVAPVCTPSTSWFLYGNTPVYSSNSTSISSAFCTAQRTDRHRDTADHGTCDICSTRPPLHRAN